VTRLPRFHLSVKPAPMLRRASRRGLIATAERHGVRLSWLEKLLLPTSFIRRRLWDRIVANVANVAKGAE
jgi:hypothetical protein